MTGDAILTGAAPPLPPSPPGVYSGRFADGQTAAIHDVRVTLDVSGIKIVDHGGVEKAIWPYEELRIVERPVEDRPIRLRNRTIDLARLDVTEHAFLAALRQRAPDVETVGMRDPAQWRRAAIWIVSLGVIFGGILYGLTQSAPVIAAMLPMSMEERIGKTAIDQVTLIFSGFGDSGDLVCRAPKGVRALEALTARLDAAADSPYKFKVSVLDIPVPNAFAAPGGYVVIFRGLIDLAESPDEIAGVLGHEMSHVTHRHATTNLVRAIGFETLIVPLITGGAMASDMMSGIGQMALQSSYTREAESEADLEAVALLQRAGIKADSFTELLLRIEAKFGGGKDEEDEPGKNKRKDEDGKFGFSIPDMLASHPATSDRHQAVAAAAAGNGGDAGMTDKEWLAFQAICQK